MRNIETIPGVIAAAENAGRRSKDIADMRSKRE